MHAEGAARDNARNKMRGELAWMRKQPKARQAKSKARQERFFELKAKVRHSVFSLANHVFFGWSLALVRLVYCKIHDPCSSCCKRPAFCQPVALKLVASHGASAALTPVDGGEASFPLRTWI